MTDIDEFHYCLTENYRGEGCEIRETSCAKENCICYRHKWPTLDQYKEEYGEEVPDDMPTWGLDRWYYSKDRKNEEIGWRIVLWSNKKEWADELKNRFSCFVCACTPWGKPSNDWRPE